MILLMPDECIALFFSCLSNTLEVNFQVKDHWEMDLSQLLSSSEQFKEKGTEFFKVAF